MRAGVSNLMIQPIRAQSTNDSKESLDLSLPGGITQGDDVVARARETPSVEEVDHLLQRLLVEVLDDSLAGRGLHHVGDEHGPEDVGPAGQDSLVDREHPGALAGPQHEVRRVGVRPQPGDVLQQHREGVLHLVERYSQPWLSIIDPFRALKEAIVDCKSCFDV